MTSNNNYNLAVEWAKEREQLAKTDNVNIFYVMGAVILVAITIIVILIFVWAKAPSITDDMKKESSSVPPCTSITPGKISNTSSSSSNTPDKHSL